MAIFIRKGGALKETTGRKIQAELDAEKREKDHLQREKEYEIARAARQRELDYERIRREHQQIPEEVVTKEHERAERAETKQKVIQQMNTLYARHLRKRQNV